MDQCDWLARVPNTMTTKMVNRHLLPLNSFSDAPRYNLPDFAFHPLKDTVVGSFFVVCVCGLVV